MKHWIWMIILWLVLPIACAKAHRPASGVPFKDDAAFLEQHTQVVFLSSPDGLARVAVNPDLQGRVMTSTAQGLDGLSFGWINRALLLSGENDPHMNAFGGEDRFWLGPEGGQFSIFFKAGEPFDLAHWYTPPPLNEGSFDVVSQDARSIRFRKDLHLVNYSGTAFDLEVDRTVRLLRPDRVPDFGFGVPEGIAQVAFQSENRITNTGAEPWVKETGLLSIWILGMFNPSPETTVVIPFVTGPETELGPVVNDAYFGKVPADRLQVGEGVIFFKGDGEYRSKIGISPRRAKPFLGSYDAAHKVLTIVHFTLPEDTTDYVNSMWRIQEHPYAGDAVNSYNDGPAAPGAKPLGPFYELESSSPAAALGPEEILGHVQTTMHFQGDEKTLNDICRQVLGVDLAAVKAAFGGKS
jgi:hypothetical protein